MNLKPETIHKASAAETSRKDAFVGINAFVRGSSNRLLSSRGLEWNSVSLEFHNASPVERSESVSVDHLITVFTDHSSRGETSQSPGRFVPYLYHPGVINLLPAGPIPACRPFTETKMIICALEATFVREVGEELDHPTVAKFRHTTGLYDPSLKSLVMLLAAEANSGGLSGRLYSEHLVHALALRFLLLAGGMQEPKTSHQLKPSNSVLRRVLDRMKSDIASDLDLKTLAAESGYSRSHFLRMFRTGMGCSPHQWLIRLRVEQAKKMLRAESTRLIDIAAACGFSSHAHFSNAFRRIMGVAPSEYRRSRSHFL